MTEKLRGPFAILVIWRKKTDKQKRSARSKIHRLSAEDPSSLDPKMKLKPEVEWGLQGLTLDSSHLGL